MCVSICEWFVYIVELILLCLYVCVLCIYVCCIYHQYDMPGMTTLDSNDDNVIDGYGKKEFPCLAKDLYHLQLITLKRTLKITRMV